MKWNVVPPSISIGGRVWWVRTKTGVWNGGLGPHQPFHSGSSGQSGGPNFRAPMISAPTPRLVQAHEGVVDAAAAAGLAGVGVPPSGLEHPFVQPFAGVPEGCLEALAFAGAEAIERDGEELDAGKGHGSSSFWRSPCHSIRRA